MTNNILPDPKWNLEEIKTDLINNKDTLFIGCISFEDRCLAALECLGNSKGFQKC